MSYNGAGLFQINTTGQPVQYNTIIDDVVFNALTADLASGLSNCVTRDGQSPATANIPMGGFKATNLGLGTAATDAARVDNANALGMCEFRLTLTTGVPVTTADVTAAETLYWTPYKGNRIALFDGTSWHMRSSAELSIDVPDATNCYDVFVYDNAGVPALELLVWTNINARATALTTQDGVLVKSGDATRRYVGSFYCTTAGNGQIEDSAANRYLWNYYHRRQRRMNRQDGTASWNYTTATVRQANGSTSNQLNFIVGVLEDAITARLRGFYSNTSANVQAWVAIGLDSTVAVSTGLGFVDTPQVSLVASRAQSSTYEYNSIPVAVGKHFLAWLEFSAATGTTTWYCGGLGGIAGEIWG